MFIVSENGVHRDVRTDVLRLEALAADLRKIANGGAPDPAELKLAPLIDEYFVARRDLPCLVGYAEGHPKFGSKPMISSELWMFAPVFGWARTYSRFYRLGNAVGPTSTQAAP